MDVFIGLDVSLASTAICVLGEKGKIVTEARVASAPESLVAYMRALPHGIAAIGLEAGPLSQWLHKGLTDAGFEAVLMETRQVKGALKAMPIKTDRRDAEGIARLLQMGWFRPVHCKSVSSQEVRALLSSRKSVLNVLTDLELSLRGVLRNFGLKLGQVSKGRYEARVRELIAGNAMLEAAAEPILRARADLRRELAGLEKLVRRLAREDRVCRLLMTMPGVGHVIALTYTSAIDDPERFRRSKDVGPWVGLTPGRDQSGERDIVGGRVAGFDPPGGVAALDGGICVGVEAGGLSGRLSVVDHVEGPAGRRPGVVAQDDVLPDEDGIGLVEAAVQADGAVLVDAAPGFEEEGVVEVEGGVGVAHAG